MKFFIASFMNSVRFVYPMSGLFIAVVIIWAACNAVLPFLSYSLTVKSLSILAGFCI
jgi:hypothetical protein